MSSQKRSKSRPLEIGQVHKHLGWKRGQISAKGAKVPFPLRDEIIKEMQSRKVGFTRQELRPWLRKKFLFYSIDEKAWYQLEDRILLRLRIDGYIMFSQKLQRWFPLEKRAKHYAR